MGHLLGVYYAPGHGRPSDLDYIARLQPPAVRILDPDAEQMAQVHAAAPMALLLPRDWALSEQKSDMLAEPEATGKRHAREWAAKIDGWRRRLLEQGRAFPANNRIVVVGINEPAVWEPGVIGALNAYTLAFLRECDAHGLRGSALNLSVGWPANTGPDTLPDWRPYEPVRPALITGRHFLTLHEYWYHSGPQDGGGWLAWRHRSCPWPGVSIIIGECGVDNYVDKARWDVEGGARGWRGHLRGDAYASQLARYAQSCDSRVVAVLPFLTDYRAREWESFDTQVAHGAILGQVAAGAMQSGGHTTHLPQVGSGPQTPTAETPTPQPDNWQRVKDFILAREGGYQDNPDDPGNWTGGAKGAGDLKGTKYGISAASYPDLDIINLSLTEAIAIYRRDYWQASGADQLPWPQCLLVMDTAALHGVGAARHWLAEVGPDPYLFAAKRLRVYTNSQHWHAFGAGWVNRVALLLEACATQMDGE